MSAVLVDTSVWRRFFAGDPRTRHLSVLLDEEGQVLTHPWVIGELILGGLSRQEEEYFTLLPSAPLVAHDEVLAFIRSRKLERRGLGWVDVNLLASALVGSARLWTLDADLKSSAKALRACFEP